MDSVNYSAIGLLLGLMWAAIVSLGEVYRVAMNWLDDYEVLRKHNPVILKVMMWFGYNFDGDAYYITRKGLKTRYSNGAPAYFAPFIFLSFCPVFIGLSLSEPWLPISAIAFFTLMLGGRSVRRMRKKHLRKHPVPH